ncbi:MAG TPA: hypothetical protein VHC22_14470 [Pirellulales bacterium]|nr:hypothetical protein [Pirellulales bacterium]
MLTAARTVICGLRWAAVLALVWSALDALVYAALGGQRWVPLRPAPLAVVQNLVFQLLFYVLKDAAFVVVGAMIAPRARITTAIVLFAVHVPLSFWNNVLSRVSFDELVLLEGRADYVHFGFETLGALLGVAYIFWSEKTKRSAASVLPSRSSPEELSPASADTKPATLATKTLIRWLRWAAVLALVCSALDTLVYSALVPEAWAIRPVPLAVVQGLVSMLIFYVLREAAFVVVGATLAPRFRLTTAIILATLHIPLSFWAHVLATGGPWLSWTINYKHFALETLGCVLGVLYIFSSEKAKGSVASVAPAPPPP